MAWWRYPYSHLRTDSEFQALADEYDSNLNELELDLRHANVDNARLEAEYVESDDISFVVLTKNYFSYLDLNKHGLNWLTNGLNQPMKKFIPMLNYRIYDYGKYTTCVYTKKDRKKKIFFTV